MMLSLHHPPFRLLLLTISVIFVASTATNDFGGDFSAGGLSGSTAPGPNKDAMGSKAASAMAIGTGGAGPGNYGGSDFKTPNYTQYTNQDFKDFLPNYEDMMEKSLKTGGGVDGGGSSFVSNFSSVNDMLKGFMELQKEQLKVDLAKTKANKAKVDLAMDYQDSNDYQDEDEDSLSKYSRATLVHARLKGSEFRSKMANRPMLMKTKGKGKDKTPHIVKIGSAITTSKKAPVKTSLVSKEWTTARFYKLIKGLLRKKDMMKRLPYTVGEGSSRLIKDKLNLLLLLVNYFKSTLQSGKNNTIIHAKEIFPGPYKVHSRKINSKSRRQQWPGMNGKYFRRQAWPGSVDDGGPPAKYFRRRDQQAGDSQQSSGGSSGGNSQSSSSGPDSTFWESWVKKYKDSPPSSGTQGSPAMQGSSEATNQSIPPPPSPSMPSATAWQGGATANNPPPSSSFGSVQGGPPPNNPWSAMPPKQTTSSPSQQGWPPPSSNGGPTSGGLGSSQGSNGNSGSSNQRKRQIGMSTSPVHGAVRIENIPGITSQADVQATNNNGDNIPYLSFALNPTTTPLPTTTASPSTQKSKIFILPQSKEKTSFKGCRKNKILMLPSKPIPPRLREPPLLAPATIKLSSEYPYNLPSTDFKVLSYDSEWPEESQFTARPLLSTGSLRFYKQEVPFGSVRPGTPVERFSSMVNSVPRLDNEYLVRVDRAYDVAEEPLAIYQVEKDNFDRPKNVKKILLDPEKGIVIDENKSGDMYPPAFPSGRKKREVKENADPNGHFHGMGGDQMDVFKAKRKVPKKTVQYQSSGTSRDYDLDYVQEEKDDGNDGGYEATGENGDEKEQEENVFEPMGENENDQQTRSYKPTGENGVQTRRRRRVKIAFEQKGGKDGGAILPDGAKETISAGGGHSPGHHEGGGITVKEVRQESEHGQVPNRRRWGRKTINFYFTW